MPSERERLTDSYVKEKVARAAGPLYLRDTEVRGFFAYHNPQSGHTCYYVQADQPVIGEDGNFELDGARRKVRQVTVPLGHALLPAHDSRRMTAADARREASRIKQLIQNAEDFSYGGKLYSAINRRRAGQAKAEADAHAQRKLAAYTLRQAMNDYLAAYPPKNQKRRDQFVKCVETHIGDDALSLPVAELSPEWISANYSTAHQVHKAFTHLSGILRYLDEERDIAVKAETRKRLKAVRKRYEPKEEELTITETHLPIIWYELDKLRPLDPYSDLMRFILLTGMRPGEAGQLDWTRVNFADESFWIPDSKNGKPLFLPMTKLTKEILERRNKKRSDEYYVFGAPFFKDGYPTSEDGSSTYAPYDEAVRKLTGDIHVRPNRRQFRKLARTTLSMDLGCSDTMVDAILNHTPKGVGARNYTLRAPRGQSSGGCRLTRIG